MELTANAYYEKAIEIYKTIISDPTSNFEDKLQSCDRMAHCNHELGHVFATVIDKIIEIQSGVSTRFEGARIN